MGQIFDYVRLCRFLEVKGVVIDAGLLEDQASKGDEHLVSQEADTVESLRGGMAEDSVVKKTYYDKTALKKKLEPQDVVNLVEPSFDAIRGGTGGAAATAAARKQQLREVLKEMNEMVNAMPDTQGAATTEDEVVEKIMKDLTILTEAWTEKKPNEDQMKIRLSHLAERWDKSVKASASSGPSSGSAPKQSFYNGFQSLDLKAKDRSAGKPAGKSAGTCKSKNAEKSQVMKSLPRFDLRRIFPTKQVSTWHLILRDLEQGREPDGQVAICDSISRVIELQL